MQKVVAAAMCVLSINAALAEDDGYFECTRPDGFVEYALEKCEEGQEQKFIGNNPSPESLPERMPRQKLRPAPQVRTQKAPVIQPGDETNLASYKCLGRSGDILYTDAKDYLAFEVYRCTRITLEAACEEVRRLKAKDPVAVISSKLTCP